MQKAVKTTELFKRIVSTGKSRINRFIQNPKAVNSEATLPPAVDEYLLLETDDFLLLESGDKLVLEG
jgi:hypothetical protein